MNVQEQIEALNERIRNAERYGMQDTVEFLHKQLVELIKRRDS